jgi:hypothetical protein
MAWHRTIFPPPLPGLALWFAENRWFAPPANFHDASSVEPPFRIRLKVHNTF